MTCGAWTVRAGETVPCGRPASCAWIRPSGGLPEVGPFAARYCSACGPVVRSGYSAGVGGYAWILLSGDEFLAWDVLSS